MSCEERPAPPGWPDSVKTMQRNWIGRSNGIEVDFARQQGVIPANSSTTDPDTIFGATFMAVAAITHLPWRRVNIDAEIQAFIEECARGGVSEAQLESVEKKGVPLGIDAINPLSGRTPSRVGRELCADGLWHGCDHGGTGTR